MENEIGDDVDVENETETTNLINTYYGNYDYEYEYEYFSELGGRIEPPVKKTILNTIFKNIYGNKQKNIYENKDKFYRDIYEYYYNGGYLTIIFTQITEILSLIFGIFFSIFLFTLLDWGKITQCGNNNETEDCGDISLYIVPHYPNIFFMFVMIFASIFTVCKLISHISNYKNLVYIHNFYHNILKITIKDLKIAPWSHVINEIVKKTNVTLNINDITNIILRNENFYIALFNNDIITIKPQYYTNQMELNLKYIILTDLENLTTSKLKRKFILYGIFNILLSIFIFIYLLIYFFVSNIEDLNSRSERIGSRRYSPIAKIKFRNYNELKHFFEKRTNKSIKYANEYNKQFHSPVMEIIGKFICLLCGSFICFFLILSMLDESILLYVRMFDRSLLFYMGIIGTISSFAKGYIRNPEKNVYNPNNIMEKVIEYTHYSPEEWKDKYHTNKVRKEFMEMFPYIIVLFLYDLISVITTPLILIFILPQYSSDIVNFIKINTIEKENVGNICTFADFDLLTKDKKMENSISIFNENHSIDLGNSLVE